MKSKRCTIYSIRILLYGVWVQYTEHCKGCDRLGRQVYQEGDYKVYRAGNDYIIHNTAYAFHLKHSHVKTLNAAKKIIISIRKRVIPRSFSQYLLKSLVRLADDDLYICHVEGLMGSREQKGRKQKYYNSKIARI